MSRIVLHWRSFSFCFRATQGSFIELKDVPKFLLTFLDQEYSINDLKFTLEIGKNKVEGRKDSTYVVVPQNEDFHVYDIPSGSKYSEEKLFGVVLQKYPELVLDWNSGYVEKISEDLSCNNIFVLKCSSQNLKIRPCEETADVNHELKPKSHDDETFLSPAVTEIADNPELKPFRQNAIVGESEQLIREVNQHFHDKRVNLLDEPEEHPVIDTTPVSVHGGSSAIQQRNAPGDVTVKEDISVPSCDPAVMKYGAAIRITSKGSSRRQKAQDVNVRRRSASEGDATDQELTEGWSRSISSIKEARSVFDTTCVTANEWQRDKSEIVASSAFREKMKAVNDSNGSIKFSPAEESDSKMSILDSSSDKLNRVGPIIEGDLVSTYIENGSSCVIKSACSSISERFAKESPLQPIRSESDLRTKYIPTSSNKSDLTKCPMEDIQEVIDVPKLTVSVTVDNEHGSSGSGTNGAISELEIVAPWLQASSPLDGEACTNNKQIPIDDHSVYNGGNKEVDSASQSAKGPCANTQLTESKSKGFTKTLVIDVKYQCDGNCGGQEGCNERHQPQWTQDVVNQVKSCISEDGHSSQSSITVVKNCGEFKGGKHSDLELHPPSISSGNSLEDYTPNTSIFQPPVDCCSSGRRQNNALKPENDVQNLALVPFPPMSNASPKEKPSSVPANLKTSCPPGCIGHMAETVKQEQQPSYLHVASQHGVTDNLYGKNVAPHVMDIQGAAIVENDTKEHELPNESAVPSSQMPYHQLLVYPGAPQGVSHFKNGAINGSPENYLTTGHPAERIEDNEGAVGAEDSFNVEQNVETAKLARESALNIKSIADMDEVTKFLHLGHYADVVPGTIIYARDDMISLIKGNRCPLPDMQRKKLGAGGNGAVSECMICEQSYAVKKTSYRCGELNIWEKLNHPHLIRLLAVMSGPRDSNSCYQFMPCMTGSLRDMLRPHRSLLELFTTADISLQCINHNALYISECTLKALDYLAMRNMQHGDVKETNILILKACECSKVWNCVCPKKEKYAVMLADFDSIKESKEAIEPKALPIVCCKVKTDVELKHEAGTEGFRAPEQLMTPTEKLEFFQKTVMGGYQDEVKINSSGPWCDIWSLGRTIIILYLGRGDRARGRIHDANVLLKQPTAKEKYSSLNEDVTAIVALKDLLSTATLKKYSCMRFVVHLADKCMKPDFRERDTACQLLNWIEQMEQT